MCEAVGLHNLDPGAQVPVMGAHVDQLHVAVVVAGLHDAAQDHAAHVARLFMVHPWNAVTVLSSDCAGLAFCRRP